MPLQFDDFIHYEVVRKPYVRNRASV